MKELLEKLCSLDGNNNFVSEFGKFWSHLGFRAEEIDPSEPLDWRIAGWCLEGLPFPKLNQLYRNAPWQCAFFLGHSAVEGGWVWSDGATPQEAILKAYIVYLESKQLEQKEPNV